ncbi:chromate transport protein ChrA [Agrococcus sp. UYP10]|uniref:hypothetical protein n=1 Tax=Agrococcus sp. UYP10 TaxID=1756355 RepID=UPI0033936E9C
MRIGLVLLWVAFLCLAGLMALLTVFYVATIDQPGAQPTGAELTLGVVGAVVPLVLLLVVLIFASRRREWARWFALVAGIGAGLLALLAMAATRSPAPETVGIALAALVGGVLLALPASGRWYRGAPRGAGATDA